MSARMRKIGALCRKDLEDFFGNVNILFSVLLPLVFVLLYKMVIQSVENKPMFLLNIGTMMSCCMGGIMVVSSSISEEKEKFTLRTLMLSNVRGGEFLTAKVIVGFVLTMACNLLVFVLSGAQGATLPIYFLATAMGCLPVLMLSALIGILCRDQMTCGTLQVPIMLLFLVPAVFGELNPAMRFIATITPLNAMMNLYYRGTESRLFTAGTVSHLLVLLGWTAVGAAAFALVYRKRGLDN